MIEETKKIEYWNFLTTEKNQPRPKGITRQRLAVIKLLIIKSEVWREIIGQAGAKNQTAAEFYQAGDAASKLSRTIFWETVRGIILQKEGEREKIAGRDRKALTAIVRKKSFDRKSRR